uniref:Uncharacterized protein n=1 Tax=Avena sativa TaxID=4498 RepID=A0ACD5X206_AVESA
MSPGVQEEKVDTLLQDVRAETPVFVAIMKLSYVKSRNASHVQVTASILLLLCFLLNGEKACAATATSADGSETWGYALVRPKAHLFWWFYKSPHRVSSPGKPWPTILWLQGGPIKHATPR